jgi:hypothetical protein
MRKKGLKISVLLAKSAVNEEEAYKDLHSWKAYLSKLSQLSVQELLITAKDMHRRKYMSMFADFLIGHGM